MTVCVTACVSVFVTVCVTVCVCVCVRVCVYSFVHDNAEERCGAARGSLVLLGCGKRQHSDGALAQ